MDTKIGLSPKEVFSVEILHLDELGYGPHGALTRREWQKECLDKYQKGEAIFVNWVDNLGWGAPANFGYVIKTNDGIKTNYEHEFHNSCTLDFVGHGFLEDIENGGWHFGHKVLFNCAVFCKNTRFNNAIFKLGAEFNHAVFQNFAMFGQTKFEGVIGFEGARFNSIAYFPLANFEHKCSFQSSVFEGYIDFEDAVFKSVGHFEKAEFVNFIPSFRSAKYDNTLLEFSENTIFSKFSSNDDAIKSLSFLKRLSDEHGQIDQALRFNALELNAKFIQSTEKISKIFPLLRFKEADFWFIITTYLYNKFSDYGRSFMRPIFGYIILLVISALSAMIYSTYSDSPPEEQQVLCKPLKDQPPPLKLPYGRAVVEYAMFRAGGLMDFTDTGKQNNAVNCRLFEEPIEPPLMRAWGIFKGIASIALLFLAALGLRNKYRIK